MGVQSNQMSAFYSLTVPHVYLAHPQKQFHVFQEGRILKERESQVLWVRKEELERVSTYNGKVGILSVRLELEQWDTIEKWAARQPVPPTMPEIVRVAVTDWMKRNIVGMKP
jgi:hypothetical protein